MNDNLFYEELIESKKRKMLLGVYTDISDSETFLTVMINRVFPDSVIFNSITSNGHYDGLVVKKIESIFKIEKESMYLKKLNVIISHREAVYPEIMNEGKDGIECLLKYAFKNRKIATLSLLDSGNSDATGEVSEFFNDKIIIKNIDQYGRNDGFSTIRLQDITYLICDGEYESGLEKLIAAGEEDNDHIR